MRGLQKAVSVCLCASLSLVAPSVGRAGSVSEPRPMAEIGVGLAGLNALHVGASLFYLVSWKRPPLPLAIADTAASAVTLAYGVITLLAIPFGKLAGTNCDNGEWLSFFDCRSGSVGRWSGQYLKLGLVTVASGAVGLTLSLFAWLSTPRRSVKVKPVAPAITVAPTVLPGAQGQPVPAAALIATF